MPISLDAGSPASPSSATATTSTTQASGSFSPPARSLVVVLVWVGNRASSSTGPTVTVADSLSNTYTAGPNSYDTRYAYAGIFSFYYAAAPGSITVTATRNQSTLGVLAVFPVVLDGCASSQAGAASATADSPTSIVSSLTGTITTTIRGSWVLIAMGDANDNTHVVVAGTTDLASVLDAPDAVSAEFGQQTSPTVTPGATTLGWTIAVGTTGYAWAALEILPAALPSSPAQLPNFPVIIPVNSGWRNAGHSR